MNVEPLSATALEPVRRPVFTQSWRDVTMLHWPVEPAAVAPLLPAGTEPDLLDGVTWVGLVPFVMEGVRIHAGRRSLRPLPHLSRFAETNVRLYATDARGRRGVVFRSLEAARLLPVLAARVAYRLPYTWARMSVSHGPDTIAYETSRRWPGPRGAGGLVQVQVGAPLPQDELALFLTARWGLYSRWYGGRTAWAPVDHAPWALHAVTVLDLSDTLVTAAGLDVAGEPAHALWSPGVDVRVGRPRALRDQRGC